METISPRQASIDRLNALPAGSLLQEFVIERLIGIGGFGIVYQATDTLLHRTVAIKEYMPTSMAARSDGATVSLRSESYSEGFETGKASFIHEARMLARFKHVALIEVFRFWEQNSTAYMATPFYEGRTLKDDLRARPEIPSEAVLKQMLLPVLDALEHMHREQIYHRDVSPDNIMILDSGQPILLDLGAARRMEVENAQALTVLVKPGYAPIEQYAGDSAIQQGPWTDIYSWAATAYFALTGKPPPPSASRIMSDSVIKLANLKPAGYSPAFLAAIDTALAVRPDDRPQSIASLKRLFTLETQFDFVDTVPRSTEQHHLGQDSYAVIPSPSLSMIVLDKVEANGSQYPNGPTDLVAADLSTFDQPAPVKLKSAKKSFRGGLVTLALACLVGLTVTFWWFAKPVERSEVAKVEKSNLDTTRIDASKALEVKADATKIEAPQVALGATQVPQATADPTLEKVAPTPTKDRAEPDKDTAQPPLDKPGVARLVIKPWGEVFVNGQSRGVSPPLKTLSLPAGDYSIEIRNGDYPARMLRLKLKPGEVSKINHTFVDPAQK